MAEPASTTELPALTRDLDRALEDIREFGVARIEGVLEGTSLARVRDALYRAAASDRERGWNTRFIMDNPEDKTNQRVWGLLSRDPVFSDLAEHPTALHFVRAVLGWPAMLSNISANITGLGGGEMVLHADQGFAPQPWGGIQGLNVAWAIDDFTDENGATRLVPGSQRQNRAPTAEHGGHIGAAIQFHREHPAPRQTASLTRTSSAAPSTPGSTATPHSLNFLFAWSRSRDG